MRYSPATNPVFWGERRGDSLHPSFKFVFRFYETVAAATTLLAKVGVGKGLQDNPPKRVYSYPPNKRGKKIILD